MRSKNADARLIADRRRALASSKSLNRDGSHPEAASPLLGAGIDSSDAAKLANRSHSADSVFTILIRLPSNNADKPEQPTIRMIPANPNARTRANTVTAATRVPTTAVRSRSVPVGDTPAGRASSASSSSTGTIGLLCGASLNKLTSVSKPNHLPLKNCKLKNHVASPWVPRSCMPVAQSPLVIRRTPLVTSATSGASTLPLDAKIIPKPFARPVGAVSTVSGSMAPNNAASGVYPPARRPVYNAAVVQAQAAAAAAAAKKSNKKPKKKNQEKRQERKAAKTLSAILLAFILTWTPYNVLILLKALAPCDADDCVPLELWNFCYYLCYINSTINPVCYALCNASFRRTYVRILTCKWHSRTKTAVQRGVYN